MAFRTIQAVLATALATSGTLVIAYPPGTSRTDFLRGVRHRLRANSGGFVSPNDFTVVFGAAAATITWNSATTLPAGSTVSVQLDTGGPDTYRDAPAAVRVANRSRDVFTRLLSLGNPVAAAANNVCVSQAVNSGVLALLNGTTAGTLDVPRNVVAAWTNTAVITVTGLDEHGNVMVEQSASGTSFTGLKAFARVTSVTFSANVTGATVGTGVRLGLPIWLPNSGNVLREFEDGAVPTAGTIVAGLAQGTRSTALTADVRGTYQPNSAPDGSRVFDLLVSVPDPNHRGNPQFAG